MDGRRWLLLGALAALPLSFAGPIVAQSLAEPRVARLARELGAPRYADRVRAQAELLSAGPTGKTALGDALRSDDLEVRLRAERLLESLAADDFWAAGHVDFAGEAPAAEVLAILTRQTGNRLLPATGPAVSTPAVAVDYRGWEFWPAVDDLGRRAGLVVRSQHDGGQPGLTLASGSPGRQPVAYAGPLRVQVTSARRAFLEDLDYENGHADVAHNFQLNLQMTWESRFRLVAHAGGPEVVAGRTATGEEVVAVQQSAGAWNVIGASTRYVSATVKLVPPSVDARSLDELHLRWPVVAVGDLATLEVPCAEAAKVWQQDDLVLDVQKCERLPSGRYELLLVVRRDLAMPEPSEILYQENDVQLLDFRGEPLKLQGQSCLLTDRGVEMKLSFAGDRDSVAARLRFSYPRLRMRRTMDIVFRDVPLPSARPE